MRRLALDLFHLQKNYDSCFSRSGVRTAGVENDPDHTLYGLYVIKKLRFDAVYMYAKFEDSSFSRSIDIIGGLKI